MEGTPPEPPAQDPRPPPRGVRAPQRPPPRRAGRRAGAHGALPEHQRPQPRRGLWPPARALPVVGRGARRAGGRGGGGDPPGWIGAEQGAADPGDPAGDRRRPLTPGRRAPRAGAGRAVRAARRGTQDGRLRSAVLLRPARHPGGHPRISRGHAPGPVPPGRPAGGGRRRDAAPGARLRPVRGAHGTDSPRAPPVLCAVARLPRMPAAANVPVCPRSGPHGAVNERDGGPQAWAEVALVGVAAVWGLTFVMVQDAIELLPTMAFLGYRFLPAALVVALVFRRQLRSLPAAGWRAGAAMGVFLTAGYVFQTLGLEQTTASNAGFITGMMVVFTPLLGAVFLAERMPAVAWAAAGVSVIGLFLLSGAGGDFQARGDGLVLLCAFAFAGHILVTSRAVRKYDVGALVAVQLALCGAISLAIGGVAGDLEAPEGSTVFSALIVTSLVASALGFFIQTYAQQHASPARTALILASEPAFAGFFGWLLADERLSAVSLLGAALILAAIVAVELVPRLRAPRPLPEG